MQRLACGGAATRLHSAGGEKEKLGNLYSGAIRGRGCDGLSYAPAARDDANDTGDDKSETEGKVAW